MKKKKIQLKQEYKGQVIFFRGFGVFAASEITPKLAEELSKVHPQYFTHEQDKEGAEVEQAD